MNLKVKMKRFWTLNRHHADGFTLVELIVVIAILAILAGVAVPVYSTYITQANKQADESLAAEIEQALLLAAYSGTLKPGASVVVYFGDKDVAVDADGDLGADAAMKAAFGDNYADVLRLQYDGWDKEIGVAGNAEIMAIVKDSNFTPDALDSLLGQVQVVVDAAGAYLSNGGGKISAEAAAILQANGIDIKAGDTLDSTTGMAAANAYVYLVGSELSGLNLEMREGMTDTEVEFYDAWCQGSFGDTGSLATLDKASRYAAEYASIYALATYIDNATKETETPTAYAAELDAAGDPRAVADSVLLKIQGAATGTPTQVAYSAYASSGEAYNDAVSFIAYMQGLTSSTDSLMQNTDLTKGEYFVDGYVASYVNSYIDMSNLLTADGDSGSTFAFIYTGEDVLCMPLDW